MSFDRQAMADALVGALSTALGETAMVFGSPPSTFNPPAVVIGFPTTVVLHSPAFAVDTCTVPVLCTAGVADVTGLDSLMGVVSACLDVTGSFPPDVIVLGPSEWRNWRILTVAGIDMLAADIITEIRM